MLNTTKYKAPALEKGLDILELLANVNHGLTQKEIAVELDRKLSEIFRMIVCLEERGYIADIPGTDRYQLTLKLFDLASRNPPVKQLVELALPVMHKFAIETNQSCHIVIHNNDRLAVVAQVDSPHPYNFSVRLGSEVDLIESASGLVLLAFSSEEQANHIIESCGKEPFSGDDLAKLEKIRTKGVCEHVSPVVKGVFNLGCPIYDHHGDVIASLTVPYIDKSYDSCSKVEARNHAMAAAKKISDQLGKRQ